MIIRVLALSLALIPYAAALEADDIRRLAAAPATVGMTDPHLAVYPRPGKFTFLLETGATPKALETKLEISCDSKIVEERYFLSRLSFPGVEDLIMVTEYDEEDGVYRKWTLHPGGKVDFIIGVRNPGARAIAWTWTKVEDGATVVTVALETYSDDGAEWRDRSIRNGRVVHVTKGSASRPE